MKRFIKNSVIVLTLAILLYGVRYAWRAFPIISGYGAKNVCSCIYLSKRPLEDIVSRELGRFPLSLGSFEHDAEKAVVTGSVFGMAKRRAFYRKGLGCTLAKSREELSKMTIRTPYTEKKEYPQDSLWPMGEKPYPVEKLPASIDSEKLHQAVAKAFREDDQDHLKNTRAVVVVYDGRLIAEAYGKGFHKDMPMIGWSMSKSITNALLGILVKAGRLDINQHPPIAAWQGEGDPRKEITIDQLLRMSSGLEWEEDYGSSSHATEMLFNAKDMAAAAADVPLKHQPDEQWYYSSGTSNLLSWVIRNTVGEADYPSFPKKVLFDKIGMRHTTMEADPSGTYVGSSYTFATAREWAKFGLLYYFDGMWEGERILPEGWVEYSATPTPKAPEGKYGAHFWLNAGSVGNPGNRTYPSAPEDMFSANGYAGQRVFIIPSKKLVIVRLGDTKRGDFDYDDFLSDILSAIK